MHHGMARYASAVSSLLADIADVMLEVRGLAFSLTPERRCAREMQQFQIGKVHPVYSFRFHISSST
jgi:hypothetical protein